MTVMGLALTLLLIAVYLWALEGIWRVPFRALGVLVAGMTVHNLLSTLLLRLQTPPVLVRGVEAWWYGVLVVIGVQAIRRAARARREQRMPRLVPLDFVAAAFAVLVLGYAALPHSLVPERGNLNDTLVSLRAMLLLPTLYLFGRVFWTDRRDELLWVVRATLGAGIVAGLFGVFELWFVPSRLWVDWGLARFISRLGLSTSGPGGLPATFFEPVGANLGLRRMVSTYLSPPALVDAGLVIAPLAAAVLGPWRIEGLRRVFTWTALAASGVGMLLGVVHLAVVSVIVEFVLLALLLRRREVVISALAVGVGAALALLAYPGVGPLVDSRLDDVRPPAGYTLVRDAVQTAAWLGVPGLRPAGNRPRPPDTASSGSLGQPSPAGQDASLGETVSAWRAGLGSIVTHPAGTGLGSEVARPGSPASGESIFLRIAREIGVAGDVLYTLLYALVLASGAIAYRRAHREPVASGFALIPLVGGLALLPIALAGNVWGDLSVTFLFWWTAGMAASAWPGRVELPVADIQAAAAVPLDRGSRP